MKKILNLYVSSPLILRIAIGLALGVCLGLLLPQAAFISVLGNLFVGALKSIAPILVFVLVIASLSSAAKGIGKRFSTVIIFYLTSTLLAAVCAVFAMYIFPVTVSLTGISEDATPMGLGEVFSTLLNNMVSNPISAMINGNYVGILTWAIIFGLAVRKIASDKTKEVLNDISVATSTAVGWVIQFAPFGIMGLVFSSVSEYGMNIFAQYGKLLCVLVGCMLLVALVVDPLLVAISCTGSGALGL